MVLEGNGIIRQLDSDVKWPSRRGLLYTAR
jgi:hypothetical protein